MRLKALSGRCRGAVGATAGLAARRRAALNFSRAPGWPDSAGLLAPWPRAFSLSLSLSPSGGGAVLGKCRPGRGGGFKKPPSRAPPAPLAAPGSTSERRPPRNAARPAGGGCAEPGRPASLLPPPRGQAARGGAPAPGPGVAAQRGRSLGLCADEVVSRAGMWGGGRCGGVGHPTPQTKHCQSLIKYAPFASRGTKEINGETEAISQVLELSGLVGVTGPLTGPGSPGS